MHKQTKDMHIKTKSLRYTYSNKKHEKQSDCIIQKLTIDYLI